MSVLLTFQIWHPLCERCIENVYTPGYNVVDYFILEYRFTSGIQNTSSSFNLLGRYSKKHERIITSVIRLFGIRFVREQYNINKFGKTNLSIPIWYSRCSNKPRGKFDEKLRFSDLDFVIRKPSKR